VVVSRYLLYPFGRYLKARLALSHHHPYDGEALQRQGETGDQKTWMLGKLGKGSSNGE